MASKAALETAIRNDVLAAIVTALTAQYETDVQPVSASELMMPVVDADGNEKFAVIKVSIPRGTRVDGGYEPYDGYQAANDYADETARKAAEKEAKEQEKARKEAEKEARRQAKKVIKTMKNDVQEVLGTGTGTPAE